MSKQQTKLNSTWLVQRLQKPRSFINPFSFGGGLKNGGLSDDAMALLQDVCSFDYMGAAEYEFGDVPKAFARIVEHEPIAFRTQVALSTLPQPFSHKVKDKPKGSSTVWIIAQSAQRDEVEQRVREIAAWTHNRNGIKGDYQSFARALYPVKERDSANCGWLEIDNGFLFFTDELMANRMCNLFAIKVEERTTT